MHEWISKQTQEKVGRITAGDLVRIWLRLIRATTIYPAGRFQVAEMPQSASLKAGFRENRLEVMEWAKWNSPLYHFAHSKYFALLKWHLY